MKAIRVDNPGKQYRLVLNEIARPAPKPDEVLIEVAASGVNHADLHQAEGNYPPPPGAPDTLGLEVSGTVVDVGADVKDFKRGDPVCALLSGGGYAQYAAASARCVLPAPKRVTLRDAAALPEVFFTVWTNLIDAARLKAGDSVLVHGGSSGIGTAAIQLCVARGHRVFATAGAAEKCAAIAQLGAEAINYREDDFVAVVKRETESRGVDVILDMVGGDYIQRNIDAAALGGRIVNIAYLSGAKAHVNFRPMLKKRLSLMATTLRNRSNEEKGAIRNALLREVWPLIESGTIKPIIDSTFSLADAQAAHSRMRSSQHIGKILLTVSG